MMKLEIGIGNGAIILSERHPATGVKTDDIRLVSRRFQALFGVKPDIRIRGRFTRPAMNPITVGHPNCPDVWDWTDVLYYQRVTMVGRLFVSVDYEGSVPHLLLAQVRPDLGTRVSVRFALPAE